MIRDGLVKETERLIKNMVRLPGLLMPSAIAKLSIISEKMYFS